MTLITLMPNLLVACAVVVATGAAVPGAAASQARTADHGRGCVTLSVVDITVQGYRPPQSQPGVQVGTFGTYTDVVYDSSGKTAIGTAVGSLDILYQAANGDLIQYRNEQWELPGGTLAYASREDRTRWASPQHGRVIGTSGSYAGLSGSIVWQVIGTGNSPTVPETFTLCPGDED